jgi:hypothetical protein
MPRWSLLAACVAVGSLRVGGCLRREMWPGVKGGGAPSQALASPTRGEADQSSRSHSLRSHPRILLNADRLSALGRLRATGAPAWRRLEEQCVADSRETIDSGYEAWDWANATLDLAICYSVARRPDYAAAALRYFRAMLDDRARVGDHAGGDEVVHHDDGYPIRTRGCFGAIAYDWLHDVPGMTPELRSHAVDRLTAWTKWFSEDGYNRDQPIANYYVGWFGAVAFAGIATDGDDARADALLRQAQRMYSAEIVPAYDHKLQGGDFPEGWQYGDMVGAILAIFADTEAQTGAGRTPSRELPWLHEAIAYRTHALWPDARHMLDAGDWSDKPAVAPAHALLALATVLAPNDADQRHARWLARLAGDPNEEWLWLAALGDDPLRPSEDPRRGATSYWARGTGAVVARTDWSSQAVWVAVMSAPSLSDHQHLDAGHFEIVRGADALVVDAGGYGSYSSLSHNVISVDDKKKNDNYAPNQGTWSDSARIARFEDTGSLVYTVADYASAFNPVGYPAEHPQRSVVRAEREMVFSRAPVSGVPSSARVVIYDRIAVTNPSYGVTFLLHGGSEPTVRGRSFCFVAGKSAAFATTLVPVDATPIVVREPTALGEGPYYDNEPPEGTTSVRIEVRSHRVDLQRRFLHTIVVTEADARPLVPARIEGEDIDGAAIDDEAYVFARAGMQVRAKAIEYRAPHTAVRHIIASLAQGARFAVGVEREGAMCRVSLEPSQGSGRVASGAGVLKIAIDPGCVLR